jgi:hypothetical protein
MFSTSVHTARAPARNAATLRCGGSQASLSGRGLRSCAKAAKENQPGVLQDEEGNTPTDAMDDTLVSRVDELRGEDGYLRKGTTNFGRALCLHL